MPSSVIHLLPDSVANQIAAGEVIQRPASVIKELMENAVDAGATEIVVSVQDAGRTQILVRDDGCGMTETDARLAFERHATSKISEAADIYRLHTMGFRGEALPSIAAVAQVDMTTCRSGEDVGTHLYISASEVVEQEPCPARQGTLISVKNIFFNLPARRRFLKSDAIELKHICNEFLRVSLAHPDVNTQLSADGQLLYKLPAGNIRQRFGGLGLRLSQQLLPVETVTSIVKISGFVGTPESAKKKGAEQYFFANNRYMRSPYFHKAVLEAYKGIIPPDEAPAYFIYFEVDPQAMDVNVHPQKTEIKFDDEQNIWQILKTTIIASLNDNNILPSIDFEKQPIDVSYYSASEAERHYNPFNTDASNYRAYPQHSDPVPQDWQQLYGQMAQVVAPTPQPTTGYTLFPSSVNANPDEPTTTTQVSALCPPPAEFKQHALRYILVSIADGLLLIDQHRAHERIMYDHYKRRLDSGTIESQMLLYPEKIVMNIADACVVSEITDELAHVGIDASVTENVVTVTSAPAHMQSSDVRDLIECLAFDSQNGSIDLRQNVLDYLVTWLASRNSIPYGRNLSTDEMVDLYNRLMTCPQKNRTPSGKPTYRLLTNAEVDSLLRF